MEVLEETNANWLVRQDDGTIDSIGKSPLNNALINHGLWGLLQDGTEVLTIQTDSLPTVTVIPDDQAKSYTLRVGDYEGIHLGPHQKSDLVDALIDGREEGESKEDQASALIALYDDIRDNQVRTDIVTMLADESPFADKIEDTADGWLFYDHLLLTWEGDFHHPDTTAYNRNGSVVQEGSRESAYDLSLGSPPSEKRELTLNGKKFRLTDAEMEFIAKALWAIENAPKEV